MNILSEKTHPRAPTEVCLTIDTEFSIAGAFSDPTNARPIGEDFVRCPAEGVEYGLPYILRTLARFDVAATFFVETLNTVYFGDEPMRRIVDTILKAGQDVQLHFHPCWLYFHNRDWTQRLKYEAPGDSCAGRSLGEMEEIIGAGLEVFIRCGWPRPVALRTGNLEADRTVYKAMARTGLKIASNIGLGYCRPSDPALHLRAGKHWIDGVLEVPVLSYRQIAVGPPSRLHLSTITGVGQWEQTALLRRARASGISPVVILTHPFEYVKGDVPGGDRCRRNRVNQRRLEALCRFLAENSEDYVSVSFGEAAQRWTAEESTSPPELQVPMLPALGTILENKVNDLVRWF